MPVGLFRDEEGSVQVDYGTVAYQTAAEAETHSLKLAMEIGRGVE